MSTSKTRSSFAAITWDWMDSIHGDINIYVWNGGKQYLNFDLLKEQIKLMDKEAISGHSARNIALFHLH